MMKLERAKRQTRKWWRKVLRELPKMRWWDFEDRLRWSTDYGFCTEYRNDKKRNQVCIDCPASSLCDKLFDRLDEITGKRYWRAPAADLCRWALREIDKVGNP